MSTTTFRVLSVPAPAMPRGARVAAELFTTATRLVAALVGRTLTRPARPSGDAAAVRELAYAVGQSDPRFAADLYAAADRHDLLQEQRGASR